MKQNTHSLLKKILLFIGIPVVITYCIVAVITLNTVNHSVTDLATSELEANSKAASNEIAGSFSTFLEISKQMAANNQFQTVFLNTTPGTDITLAPGFAEAKNTLERIKETDPDNIMAAWIVDIDTSKLAQSDGYLSGADWDVTKRPWYTAMVEKQGAIMTEPYEDTSTKLTVVSVVAPVYKPGTTEMIGATGIDFNIDSIYSMLQELKLGDTGYYILASGEGQLIYHPNESYKNINVAEADMSDNVKNAILDATVGLLEFTNEGQESHGYVSTIGDTGWVVATGMPNEEFQSTFNTVKTTLFIIFALAVLIIVGLIVLISRRIVAPIKKLAMAADNLAVGDISVDVSDITASKDEVGLLAESFSKMIDNIKEQAGAAERIAAGDLSLDFKPKSDKDVLAISLISVIDTLRSLIKEAEEMTEAAEAGRLEYRGNSQQFKGGYHEIIEGFNKTLDGIIRPLKVSADYMERISKGDIPEKITDEYYGDLNEIKNNINTCIDAVNALIADAGMLSEAAVEGKLSVRADASRHGGDFAKIIDGVNHTLDSVIGPLNIAAKYVDQIGRGEIPPTITDTYYGDFNEIKNSINACIEGLGALVEGKDILGRMSKNDCSVQVQGHYLGIYAEIAESINTVSDMLRSIVAVVNNVASGNLADLEDLKKAGKKSENDTLVPALITMIESIKSMVEETGLLANSAVAGKLSTRGNAGKFSGEYAKVIEGINSTLDAVIEPIQEALTVIKEMANGNLHVMMEGNYQGDHAEIKEALNGTLINLQNYVSEISRVLAEIGNGNLDQTITAEYRGDFVEIKDSLNQIIASLNQVMGNINVAADQVASGSRQVSVGSQALSQGSTEQASSIEELTASITEIASQTKQNAVNANQASDLATEAKNNAEKGNEHMKEMLSSMSDISESSTNISKIIKVIDDIAFQTNILALNAAVEAARAGQHGKGFAVVAEEVRNLAARSAEAAKETTALIEGSIDKVQAGTRIANETASALNQIVEGIEKAANLVGDIASSSNEQASGISQVNSGIEQVAKVVQNNSATAEESAAASEELSSQAELLKQMVGQFKLSNVEKELSGRSASLLEGNTPDGNTGKTASSASPRILLDENGFDKY